VEKAQAFVSGLNSLLEEYGFGLEQVSGRDEMVLWSPRNSPVTREPVYRLVRRDDGTYDVSLYSVNV
jgi:hypothetical protein